MTGHPIFIFFEVKNAFNPPTTSESNVLQIMPNQNSKVRFFYTHLEMRECDKLEVGKMAAGASSVFRLKNKIFLLFQRSDVLAYAMLWFLQFPKQFSHLQNVEGLLRSRWIQFAMHDPPGNTIFRRNLSLAKYCTYGLQTCHNMFLRHSQFII